MALEGRMEKRLEIGTAAFLLANHGNHASERVKITNVSAHGARVVTARQWLPEEQVELIFPSGNNRVQAKVVYCHLQTEGSFRVGLRFQSGPLKWPDSAEP